VVNGLAFYLHLVSLVWFGFCVLNDTTAYARYDLWIVSVWMFWFALLYNIHFLIYWKGI
jgi:hypothetical protein